jgi:excisionase family DNA binding protein
MNDLLTRPPAEALRLLLTARQAAEALAVSQRTLWELTARGELTPIRLPGRGKARAIRYAVTDLEIWIQRRKAGQTRLAQ